MHFDKREKANTFFSNWSRSSFKACTNAPIRGPEDCCLFKVCSKSSLRAWNTFSFFCRWENSFLTRLSYSSIADYHYSFEITNLINVEQILSLVVSLIGCKPDRPAQAWHLLMVDGTWKNVWESCALPRITVEPIRINTQGGMHEESSGDGDGHCCARSVVG